MSRIATASRSDFAGACAAKSPAQVRYVLEVVELLDAAAIDFGQTHLASEWGFTLLRAPERLKTLLLLAHTHLKGKDTPKASNADKTDLLATETSFTPTDCTLAPLGE